MASYVLGDSVTQFSTVIGVYLFAMGIGAWVSHMIHHDLCARFVATEIAVALIGGGSGAVLFLAFPRIAWFRVLLYGQVFVVGLLVGLEIPLLMRILQDRYEFKALVSRVLTADYLGALLASLAFPLFLVPKLGLIRGGFVVGMMNALVALGCTYILKDAFRRPRMARWLQVQGWIVFLLLGAGMMGSDAIISFAEAQLYSEPIIYAEQTPYQRLVMTRGRNGFQLYLNGHLQFTSYDEHRYHEALVHPAFAAMAQWREPTKRVLVLGGGDGLAVREIRKYPDVKEIWLVDLDPAVTTLARKNAWLTELNEYAFDDPRLRVINQDAMVWLQQRHQQGLEGQPIPKFDVMIIDFPDPSTYAVGKLYTTRFYQLAKFALSPRGVMVVQATSPLYARLSYWCIYETLMASSLYPSAFHVAVPSFGEWGFFLAAHHRFEPPSELSAHRTPQSQLRYINNAVLRSAFVFAEDMGPVQAEANRLDNQVLVQIYGTEWSRWQ